MSSEKILLTVQETAALTGFSPGTLRHWISQRRIPVVRFSARCVRLRREDVDRWIERLSVDTGDERKFSGKGREPMLPIERRAR